MSAPSRLSADGGAPSRLANSTLATIQLPLAELSATPTIVDTLGALIEAHGTLYDWAADQPQPRALRGRAPVYIAALPDDLGVIVVRHAWHGGLLAPFTGDRFRGTGRANREFVTSNRLRACGIPTTEVLGFARYRAGFGLYRIDVVSRFVPDAFDLGVVAAGLVPGMACDEALDATRTLLVRLADTGVVHPDLNVKNVLLVRAPRGALAAMIIDVDVVQWDTDRSPAKTMAANVARLSRSLRKWRTRFGCDLSDDMVNRFASDALAATPARAPA